MLTRRVRVVSGVCCVQGSSADEACEERLVPRSQLWSGDLTKAGSKGSSAPDAFGDLEFTAEELHTLVCDLLQSTREERRGWEGIKGARVDTVVAGAVLLQVRFCTFSPLKCGTFTLECSAFTCEMRELSAWSCLKQMHG